MAYWAFSFSSGEAEFTTMATPPSHVPAFMSGVTDEMNFPNRMWNTAIKFFFARPFMLLHTYITDNVIGTIHILRHYSLNRSKGHIISISVTWQIYKIQNYQHATEIRIFVGNAFFGFK